MKIYDKDMYNTQEKLQSAILVIVVFLLGFFAGFMTNKYAGSEKQNVQDNGQNNQSVSQIK